jgi:RNA polymerase sigma-70 factor (ECF subfamily)
MTVEQFNTQEQASLAGRIHAGDAAAEEELVRWFGQRVFLMMMARTRDREAARELAQEVLIAVLLALRNGDLREKERLAAFVHGTARNVANNYLRERSHKPPLIPVEPDHAIVLPSSALENSEQLSLVHRALERLEAAERTVLLLTLVQGLKPGEIAERLGCTPEVARTRKSRALKKVKAAIRKLSRK